MSTVASGPGGGAAGSGADPVQRLAAGVRELGLPIADTDLARLARLGALLLEWNARLNLTAIREPLEVVHKHLLDSLAVLPWLPGRRIADLGSGAGFPGLPLAIAAPERSFTLIEATGKKVRFIEAAIAALGVRNAHAEQRRAEQWQPPEPFDAVVARAVGSLSEIVRVAGHLCAAHGVLLAMKGRYPQAELTAVPQGWHPASIRRLEVPGLAAERHLVELARTHERTARR